MADRVCLCNGVGLILEYRGSRNVVEVIDCPEPTCPHRDERPGLVLPAAKVQRVHVSEGDVLLVRMSKGDMLEPEAIEPLTAELGRLATEHKARVLLVDNGWSLEHADEDAMRRLGWVRATG